MAIFNSYVSLPEGNITNLTYWSSEPGARFGSARSHPAPLQHPAAHPDTLQRVVAWRFPRSPRSFVPWRHETTQQSPKGATKRWVLIHIDTLWCHQRCHIKHMICIYIYTYGHIFVYVHVVCACHRDVSIYASFGLENHVRLLSNVICQYLSEMSQKMDFFSRGFSIAIFDYRRLQSILTAIVVVTRIMF